MPFSTLSEQVLPWKVVPQVVSWCPTMDMVSFAPTTGGIALLRLNGDKVWINATPASISPKRIATKAVWLNDGKSLGVIYDDGSYSVLQTANGKLLYSDMRSDANTMRWAVSGTAKAEPSLETARLVYNFIDVDPLRNMPRLSPLPTNSQTLAMINSIESTNTNELSMCVVGTKHKSLSISIYGVFSIGELVYDCKDEQLVVEIEANADLSLLTAVVTNTNVHELLVFSNEFVSNTQGYMPNVTIIPAIVVSTIKYIEEGVVCLGNYAQMVQDENRRLNHFFNITLEDLSKPKEKHTTLASYLFETLITGELDEVMKTWIDTTNENGFKRWHKKTTSAYDSFRKTICENIVPGCERVSVLLSRMYGLAQWEERGVPLGLTEPGLWKDALDADIKLMKMLNGLLWKVNDEYVKLRQFAVWLCEIFESRLSRSMHIKNDGITAIKTSDVANYISDVMGKSSLESVVAQNDIETSISIQVAVLNTACNKSLRGVKSALQSYVKPIATIPLADTSFTIHERFVDSLYILAYSKGVLKVYTANLPGASLKGTNLTIDEEIIQAEFLNDDLILCLTESRIFSFNYRELEYQEFTLDQCQAIAEASLPLQDIIIHQQRQLTTKYCRFACNSIRDIGCLLNSDCQRVLYFDLSEGEDEGEDEEMDAD